MMGGGRIVCGRRKSCWGRSGGLWRVTDCAFPRSHLLVSAESAELEIIPSYEHGHCWSAVYNVFQPGRTPDVRSGQPTQQKQTKDDNPKTAAQWRLPSLPTFVCEISIRLRTIAIGWSSLSVGASTSNLRPILKFVILPG